MSTEIAAQNDLSHLEALSTEEVAARVNAEMQGLVVGEISQTQIAVLKSLRIILQKKTTEDNGGDVTADTPYDNSFARLTQLINPPVHTSRPFPGRSAPTQGENAWGTVY